MEILTKVIHTIVLLLNDANVMVVKKVMLCLTQLYRLMLLVSRRMLGLPNQLHTCQIFNLPPECKQKYTNKLSDFFHLYSLSVNRRLLMMI